MIQAIAWLLVILPAVNTLFVFDATRRYLRVERHPILLVIFTVKLALWLLGIAIAFLVVDFLMHPHPVTDLGIAFGLALVVVQLLPAFIWIVLRRFEA